jgi:hypothetical protein
MDASVDGADPATEQLYDELMARAWALHSVVQTAGTDVRRADVSAAIAAAARCHVSTLGSGGGEALRTVHALLWPASDAPAPDHPWWATPLGQLMRGRQPEWIERDRCWGRTELERSGSC